ncbi:unnamed protein product, partial [marine sediment metagenome]
NKAYQFNLERLSKSLALAERAAQLSPTRPQIYYESGYSQIYLGKYYQSLGQTEKAEELFSQSIANIQKAIDLNDRVLESYINMVMVLFTVDRSDQVQFYLSQMDEFGLNYHSEEKLTKMANSAIHAEEYQWTLKIYRELTELVPEKPDYWIDLALSYAHLGQKEKAIEMAEKVKEFGGEYAEQSELFIKDVLAGKFD